jgi:uncharacterized protein YndB with AHSA1/START domain
MSTDHDPRPPGDRVRVSVAVAVPPAVAFDIFTREIDRWWRRGRKFRQSGHRGGFIRLEPGVGGRLFESIDADDGEQVFVVGRVLVWEPPSRLSFTWRNSTFTAEQSTEVELLFESTEHGTLVTLTHHGWASLPPDHPVRHGRPTAAFVRGIGMWWADQLTSLQLLAQAHAQHALPIP